MTTSDKDAAKTQPPTTASASDATKYYYPNKTPDLQEVYPGYEGWRNSGLALAGVVVLPVAIVYALLVWTSSKGTYELYTKLREATTALVDEHPNKLFLLVSVLTASFIMALVLSALYP